MFCIFWWLLLCIGWFVFAALAVFVYAYDEALGYDKMGAPIHAQLCSSYQQ